MKNVYAKVLLAIFATVTTGLAADAGEPSVAIITGKVRNPTSREITFKYDLPWALGRYSVQRVRLDTRNRFALEIPVAHGTFVRGSYKGRVVPWKPVRQAVAFLLKHGPPVFFVEPGDSLHIEIHPGYLYTSFKFSGRNADNNRFIAEWYPRFQAFQKKIRNSREMEAGGFSRMAAAWRLEQLDFLERRRSRYAFSPEFVEYVQYYFNYTYAVLMSSYPTNYRFATGRENPNIPHEFYDFLKQVPLVEEKAIGVEPYYTYLVRTLDLELEKTPTTIRLSDQFNLAGLNLRETTVVRIDSLYERYRGRQKLSTLIDLVDIGLPHSVRARLDSLYDNKRNFKQKRRLSEMVDLSDLHLPPEIRVLLDSLYENRQPLRLSQKLDLSGLGLPLAVQGSLDSIYTIKRRRTFTVPVQPRRYDLAKRKLKGRVRNWFLARELISGFQKGGDSFVWADRKWRDFRATNTYPEYNAPVRAALKEGMVLTPGRPAPHFTLPGLDGLPVSLNQFRGKVVFLDFWASWCGPCISDLPFLKKIREKTTGLPVVFVNLSLDSSESAWRRAIQKHGIEAVHVRSGPSGSGTTSAYNVRGIPAYFLVDPHGMILEHVSDVSNTDAVVAKILKSLGSV